MLGGRLKRPFGSRGEKEQADSDAGKSGDKGKDRPSPKTAPDPSDGVTLQIPSWFLRALGVVAILALIGGGVWYFGIRDTGPSAAEKQAEAQRKQQALDAAAVARCQAQTGPVLSAEEDLESRLNGVGINESDYLTRVGNISAAYGQLPIKQLGVSCLTKVGVPSESAMNAYIGAGNTWNNCITDFSCDEDSIDPQLQAQWAKATTLINEAKLGMSQVTGR